MRTAQISLVLSPSDTGMVAEKLHRRLRAHLETSGAAIQDQNVEQHDEGARGVADIVWGVLQVTWPAVVGSLTTVLSTALIDFVKGNGRPVSVRFGDREITLEKASAEEQRALLEEFFNSSTEDD